MTEEQDSPDIAWIPAATALSAIARNLRGNLNDNGVVTAEDRDSGCFVSIELSLHNGDYSGCDLMIRAGVIQGGSTHCNLGILRVEHLYATWEAPGLVSFFTTQEDRFSVINVNSHAMITLLDGVDCRKGETQQESARHSDQRRRFYHIGKLEGETEVDEER